MWKGDRGVLRQKAVFLGVCPRKKGVSVVKFLQGYYPFGGTFQSWTNTTPRNQYLYNQGVGETKFSTERQMELNVDFTKRRMYDYNLGRFWQVDPLADVSPQESLSPYHYSFNNPIRYNDPFGEMGTVPISGEGIARAFRSSFAKASRRIDAAVDAVSDGAQAVGGAIAQGASNIAEGFNQAGEFVGELIDCGCLPQTIIVGNDGPIENIGPPQDPNKPTVTIDMGDVKDVNTVMGTGMGQNQKGGQSFQEMAKKQLNVGEGMSKEANKQLLNAKKEHDRPMGDRIEVRISDEGDTTVTRTRFASDTHELERDTIRDN